MHSNGSLERATSVEIVKRLLRQCKEPILYIVFGVLTTLVNYVVYFILTRFCHIPYVESNVAAWAAAVLFAYITNKRWVFETKSVDVKTITKELGLFVAARLLSGIFDTALLILLVEKLSLNDMIAKIFNGVIVIVLNYFLSKFIVFKKNTSRP